MSGDDQVGQGPGRWSRRRKWRLALGIGLLVVLVALVTYRPEIGRIIWRTMEGRVGTPRTVADRVAEFGPAVDARLAPRFAAAGVAYPPREVALIALKDERQLELWADGGDGGDKPRRVHVYPILAASGGLGPKLREGDRQVPEGLYPVESLNPNSRYHLALRVGYPNAFDRAQAARDGRTQLGGDIMIHGEAVSIGCLAMGNEAAEELFVLAARVGRERVRVIISPIDFRCRDLSAAALASLPDCAHAIHADIRAELASFTATPSDPTGG